LAELGYIFAWQKLDASSFLLRQRRTRIWGVADLMGDSDQHTFQNRMKKTIDSMSGTALLDYSKVFDLSLPKQRLKNESQQKKLDQAIAEYKLKSGDFSVVPDVFMDTSSGKNRKPEAAEHIATCIRPTHHIYSSFLGRCLTAKELWICQGLFESAFPNGSAVDDLMKNQVQAQDLAGRKWEGGAGLLTETSKNHATAPTEFKR